MHTEMNRRDFVKAAGAAAGALLAGGAVSAANTMAPRYLADYTDLYAQNPRTAARKWFAEANFGLFMHYGLYSLLARGEWVQLRDRIPLAEYEKLKPQFTAHRFDADYITDLACHAEMQYVNITARHHDSFALFETEQWDWHSVASPAKRDFVAELAEQCDKKGLGLFCYYSYALDWRHPYYYTREFYSSARPAYPGPEPRYLFQKDEDFQHYIDFVHAQIRELLTNYGPIAGIWLDPIMGYYARPDLYPLEETYALIRSLQPQTLISFKQGANGDEDFATPERDASSLAERAGKQFGPESAEVAERAWQGNKDKPNETCDTLQPRQWGYNCGVDGQHLGPDEVEQKLKDAWGRGWNLLLNTGPLPDGSIYPHDADTLREVGKRIRAGDIG